MKKAKLWVELIFIFALPVIFMVLCFNFKTVNTYDTNNNLLTSQKVLEVNNVSFLRDYNDNLQYKNYLDFNQLAPNINLDNYTRYNNKVNITLENNRLKLSLNRTGYIYENGLRMINYIELINNHKYYYQYKVLASSDTQFFNEWFINSASDNISLIANEEYYYKNIKTCQEDRNTRLLMYTSQNDIGDYYEVYDIELIDLTEMFGAGYEPSTITELSNYIDLDQYYDYIDSDIISYESNNIISSDYKLNYTWYSAIFYNLFDSLQLEYNVLLQIIITYTILWFLMFIIWHLLYCTFDFFAHFGRRRDI